MYEYIFYHNVSIVYKNILKQHKLLQSIFNNKLQLYCVLVEFYCFLNGKKYCCSNDHDDGHMHIWLCIDTQNCSFNLFSTCSHKDKWIFYLMMCLILKEKYPMILIKASRWVLYFYFNYLRKSTYGESFYNVLRQFPQDGNRRNNSFIQSMKRHFRYAFRDIINFIWETAAARKCKLWTERCSF